MAESLDALDTQDEGNGLDALDVTDVDAGPKGHEPSNKNHAAYTALMTNEPMGKYRSVLAELNEYGQSSTRNELVDRARSEVFAQNKDLLVEVLADESLSDEMKRSAALKAYDQTSELYDSRNMFASKSLAQDSAGENPEQEFVRVDVAKHINDINEHKRQSQYELNAAIAVSDTTMGNLMFDFVEMILPFDESARVNNVRNKVMTGEGDQRGEIEGLFSFLGETKGDLREMVRNAPPEKRLEITKKIIEAVDSSSSIVLLGDNELIRYEALKAALEDGYYGDFERWVDNTVTVLDAVGVGALLKRPVKFIAGKIGADKAGRFAKEQLQDIWRKRFVRNRTQPASPAETAKEVNPDKARKINQVTEMDESGEMAEAMYGTTREDALAGDALPEILTDGTVRNKVNKPQLYSDLSAAPERDVLELANKDGGIYYFEDEVKQMATNVFHDFKSVAGIRMIDEMSQIGEHPDGGFLVRAVYSGKEGGFALAEDAVALARFNLKKYGIDESEISLLKRDADGEYKPVEGVPTEAGDYRAVVDYRYQFNPLDIGQMMEADVKFNLFDRSTWGLKDPESGTFQRHLLDVHSMLHPKVAGGASVAVDRAAGLESMLLGHAQEFGDGYQKLAKDRQALVEDIIRESNFRGLEHDRTRLIAEGFSDAEIKVLDKWRSYWDTMYVLENADLAKTLRARGFQLLEDKASDTRFFGRPISEGSAKNVKTVYDVNNKRVTELTEKTRKELYDPNNPRGKVLELREPELIDGEWVTHVMAKESYDGSMIRGIRDHDKILNYRKGYYTVQYTAPKFIKKRWMVGGKMVEKTLGVAGDVQQAKKFKERQELLDEDGAEYFVVDDTRGLDAFSDEYWSMQNTSGRIAQRARGERLQDASQPLATAGGDHSFVMGPVDSMVNAARSVSNRVSMRNYMETSKQRFLNQFGDFLSQNAKGEVQYPRTIGEIRDLAAASGVSKKKMADAITTFEYLKYLENGYINTIDKTIQASFRGIADALGDAGLTTAEKAARTVSTARGPMSLLKNAAFTSYLALNPLRQFVVQGHQATLLAVNFPQYVLSQRLAKDTGGVLLALVNKKGKSAAELSGKSSRDIDKMAKEFKDSGLLASVDRQNLVEGALTQISDESSRFSKTAPGKLVGKVISGSRKIGFDSGETINILTSFLAHRDEMVKKVGRFDLTQRELEEVVAKARNYTYNMNFAGDLPYNQNSLNVVFQFFQVPHKALTSVTLNRGLTGKQKRRLAAYQVGMFSLPPAAMYGLFGEQLADIPEEPREAIVQGLQGYAFNKMANLLFDEPSKTDFSSLAPADAHGMVTFFSELLTNRNLNEIIAKTPGGQLFFGTNPRFEEAVKSVARLTGVIDDFATPTQVKQTAQKVSEISSGMSNYWKAKMAFEYGKLLHAGSVVDENVSGFEAAMKLFGFSTMDETLYWYQKTKQYETTKEFRDDVIEHYRMVKRHLADQGVDTRSADYYEAVIGDAFRAFDNKEAALAIWEEQMKRDLRNGDDSLAVGLIRKAGIMTGQEFRAMVAAMPNMTEEQKQRVMKIADDIDKAAVKMED